MPRPKNETAEKTRRCVYLHKSTRPRLRALMHMVEYEVTGMSEMIDLAVEFMFNAYSGQEQRRDAKN